jgi:rSAM/selenodomain-associated transferase 2
MISVVIPTYNEADQIHATITKLRSLIRESDYEIIVSDGGSTDNTVALATEAGARICHSARKGRAAQMNAGATMANGAILYFLHADTIPPDGFDTDILASLGKGYKAGCFTLSFDHSHWFLKANCWFTRFNVNAIRFGDQSLFVTKAEFDQANGFSEAHVVMEDQELIRRLQKGIRFTVIQKPVITSARKYLQNGIYKTQGVFFIIYFLYKLGFSQTKLVSTYRKMLSQDKV